MSDDKKNKLKKELEAVAELVKNSGDATSIDALISTLKKARNRMSDEHDPFDDDAQGEGDFDDLESKGFRVFDAEDEEGGDAAEWLRENDPSAKKVKELDEDEEEESPENEDDLYSDVQEKDYDSDNQDVADDNLDADSDGDRGSDPKPTEDAQPLAAKPAPEKAQKPVESKEVDPEAEEDARESRFPQPSRDELVEMRQYTRPWEDRARDSIRLRAEAHKNPVLHHEGQLVEARNKSHRPFQDAYQAFTNSPDYQNADPISQMEMEAGFHDKWHKENPDHLVNAVRAHGEAHGKGLKAKDLHAAAKDEQIRHVMRGGMQTENPTSTEAGMQMAGGSKDEEGTTGSVIQDSASSFAFGNQELLNQVGKHSKKYKDSKEFDDHMRQLRNPKIREGLLAKNPELEFAEKNQTLLRRVIKGNERAKSGQSFDQIMGYGSGEEKDVESLLGNHPNLKDENKRGKVDKFFQKYYPLIGMSASRTLKKLGIDPKRTDIDLGILHEAGLHGLFQAINDYEHENPKKTGFSTHAGHKIRGLMQTAMRGVDQIPTELRVAAKGQSAKSQMPVTDIKVPTAQPATQPSTPSAPSEAVSTPAAPPKPPVSSFIQGSKHPGAGDILDRLKRTDTQRSVHGATKPKTGGGEE